MTEYDPRQEPLSDAWPRYFVRYDDTPFADGVVYIRCDSEEHSAGFTFDGQLVWEYHDGEYSYRMIRTRWLMCRVSPAYVLNMQVTHNTGVSSGA